MELYLVKDQIVRFVSTNDKQDFAVRVSDQFPATLEPVLRECEDSKDYCKFIGNQATPVFSDKCNLELGHKWRAHLTIPNSTSDLGKQDLYHVSKPENGTILYDVLLRQFSKENLSFHFIIKDLNIHYSCGCSALLNLEFKDSSVHVNNVNFPEHELHPTATMRGLQTTQHRMTVTVKLNYAALVKVPLESLSRGTTAANCKRLLEEALGSDLVIVAANGAEVKCHKGVLMVSSDAFRAMFENQMKEGTTNRLEMPDMSEAGVRAFLKYVYSNDLEAASATCDIALELFRAGDKYGMAVLKRRIKIVICSKSAEWFNVGMAVRLSLLVQDMEEKEEIFKKTAEVLKWYSTNKSEELLASEEYEELFRSNPQIGMKLFSFFLKFA